MSTIALHRSAARRVPLLAETRLGTWALPAFVAATGAAISLRPALDPDLGWHLRAGQAILASRQPNHLDAFSSTFAGQPWADFEWLWEAATAALRSAAGNLGLVLANAGGTAATILLIYLYLRLRNVAPVFASLGSMAGLVNLLPYADVRPGMTGPLFCALALVVLELARTRGRMRWLLLLLPLQMLWANVHGSYLQSILLCACYGAAALWQRRTWRAALPWLAAATGLLGASLVNPMGLGLLRFTLAASRMAWNRDHNGEWLSPNFHSPTFWPLLITILVSLAFALRRRPEPLGAAEGLLVLGGTLAALQSNQFLPFYAVVAAPVLAQLLQGAIDRPVQLHLRVSHGIAFAAALAFLAALGFRSLQPAAYESAIEKRYPVAAVAYIQEHRLSGPMFNDFDWGSYLIDALPNLPVFVDGRTEMYGDAFLKEQSDLNDGIEPPGAIFDRYGVRLALIRPDSALATELRLDGSWTEAHHDAVASVFVRQSVELPS